MGLDMYLRASEYVTGYKHDDDTDRGLYSRLLKEIGLTEPICEHSPSLTVNVTVAYWRKANAIHNWFVENVQDGKDECQDSYVSREQLTHLRDLCKEVLANPALAAELLAPKAGFFFGSTDIDDYYKQDLNDTITQLTRVLDDDRLKGFNFYYHSSW